MIRRIAHLLALSTLLALVPAPARAQLCTLSVSPTLDFGTTVGLPTPATAVTATVTATCTPVFPKSIKVCVGIGAGSGTGSTVTSRTLSITTPAVDAIGYGLYRDAAHSVPFGETGGDRGGLSFLLDDGPATKTLTIYGRLTGGQVGKSVGNYLSDLPVTVIVHDYARVQPEPDCSTVAAGTQQSTLQARLLVDPACTITAAPLAFGNVSGLTGYVATTNLSVDCTRNGAYTIALDGGTVTGDVNARRMRRGAGPATIDYQLYRDATRTLVWGNTPGAGGNVHAGTGDGLVQSVPVYGEVPAQADQPEGTYTDTVTATVTF